MSKSHYQKAISEKEKKSFTPFLSEDEELVVVTGFSTTYLRSRFLFHIIWPGGISMIMGMLFAYVYRFNFGYGLLVGLVGAIILAITRTMHIYHANRYLLTTHRVLIKKGVFAVQITSALYDKITHIEVDQSFTDKLFMKHGKITINTAGLNKGEISLNYVEYPIEFKNLLERLINREREQFGLRSGPVVTLEGEVV